jgi:hypothetical protein
MSLEITGKLLVKYDTQVVSDRFKKREFVLELTDEGPNGSYTNYAKMQLVQNKTEVIDRFKEGDTVKVSFNIKGSRYDKDGRTNYFTNLDAWRVEAAEAGAPAAGGNGGYAGAASGGGNNYGGGNSYSGGNANGNASFSAPSDAADDLPF